MVQAESNRIGGTNMGLFAQVAKLLNEQNEALQDAKNELQEQAIENGISTEQLEAYIRIASKLSSKAERTGIKLNQLHTDLQKAFKKYGKDIVESKADVDLKELYGIEYAGVAIEKFGRLIVYGEAVVGEGTEEEY